MPERPTWSLIDECQQALNVAEGLANTIASRRRDDAGSERAARQVAENVRRSTRALARVEREDEVSADA